MPIKGRAPRGRPVVSPYCDADSRPKGENRGGRPPDPDVARARAARKEFDRRLVAAAVPIYDTVFEAATKGDTACLKELLVRLVPQRLGTPIAIPSLRVATPSDCGTALEQLVEHVTASRLTPDEAIKVAALIERRANLFTHVELSEEFRKLEARIDEIAKRRAQVVPLRLVNGEPT